MKKLILVILLLLFIAPTAVIASDVSDALYYGIIRVSNNSTAESYVSTNCTNLSSAVLINEAYMNSTANDTSVISTSGADIAYQPGYGSSAWVFWVPSIGSNTYLNYILYTNSSGGKQRYFPNDSGMTTSDAAGMELAANGSAILSGFINTEDGAGSNIVYKPNALQVYVSGNEEITARVLGASSWTNVYSAEAAEGAWVTDTNTEAAFNQVRYKVYENQGVGGTARLHEVEVWDTISGDWLSPDSASGWTNSSNACDGDTGTFATASGSTSWTPYCTLVLPALVDCTKVRFWYSDPGDDFSTSEIDQYESPVSANVTAYGDNVTVDNFEWGNDGDSLSDSGGDITWVVTEAGSSEVEIDTAQQQEGSKSARFYRDGTNHATGSFSQSPLTNNQQISFYARKDTNSDVFCLHGDSTSCVYTRTGTDEHIYYYDGSWHDTGATVAINTWYHIQIKNISWNDGTFDIYLDGVLIQEDASTHAIGTYNGEVEFWNVSGTSEMWIDDVRILNNLEVGEHIIEADYDGSDFTLKIDEGESDEIIEAVSWAGSIPDNANDWVVAEAAAVPYMEYYKHYVGGVLKQHIEWEYGTTFTDLSGNSNDATPSFRTASTDANVSAEMISFQPVSEAQAPAYTLSEPSPFITATPTVTGNFSTNTSGSYPGAALIAAIAAGGETPAQLPFNIIALFVILTSSLGMTWILRSYGTVSLNAKIITIVAVMGILIAINLVNFWMLVLFLIMGLTFAMGSMKRVW